jgi:hypothetical protein
MQKWGARFLAVAVWLCAASASAVSFSLDALPSGPVASGNGQLEFSNFQFFSPFGSVDPADVTLTVLDDGIRLSGPLTVTNDVANFFLLYEVSASAGIEGVSLQLDSDVDASILGLVLSTKQILGERVTRPGKGKGKDSFPFRHDFELGPFGYETLAHLKTADWQIGGGKDDDCGFRPPLGLGRDGAIRLVEAGFAARDSLRVVEGVTLSAIGGSATWESSTNRFSVVPEPGTAGTLLLGLALLAGRRRGLTSSR